MISAGLSNYTSTCSRIGATLAPIPSSIIDQQSSRNATLSTATDLGSVEPLTGTATVQGWPTVPLPTVATTFALPLATGAAARRGPQYWPLGGSVVVPILLGMWE
jgi:hypothetical protein